MKYTDIQYTQFKVLAIMKTVIFLLILLNLSTAAYADVIKLTPDEINTMAIEVAQVEGQSATKAQRFPGEVVLPPQQVRVVTSPQSGLIDRLTASPGQVVKQWQSLGHIVSDSLPSVQSEYLQTLTKIGLAEQTLQRDEALFKDGIIAKRRYLEAKAVVEELNALLAEKKQRLVISGMSKQSISALTRHRTLQTGLSISAPISGHVIEQYVHVGQRVEAASPLYQIATLSPLWIDVKVPVEQAAVLKPGLSVDMAGQAISGKVITILRSVDRQTQAQVVRVEVTNGASQLALGQFVEVELQESIAIGQHVSLPKASLVHNGHNTIVFKQAENGFEPITVKVIGEQSNQAIVEGALSPQDRVAVKGLAALKGAWLGIGDE